MPQPRERSEVYDAAVPGAPVTRSGPIPAGSSEVRLGQVAQHIRVRVRSCSEDLQSLEDTLSAVILSATQALNLRRAGLWQVHAARGQTRRLQLHNLQLSPRPPLATGTPSSQDYLAALRTENALAIEHAASHPFTRGLAPYLENLHIRSLLDVPLGVSGEVFELLRFEQVGHPRRFSADEADFAGRVGESVRLLLETQRRVRAEMHAEGYEAKYKQLVESLPVTVYAFDFAAQSLTYVSPQGVALAGYGSVDEIITDGVSAWLNRIHPEDRPGVVERLKPDGPAGGAPLEVAYRICPPGAPTRWVRDVGHVIRDASGQPISVQGVVFDVTAEKEAEAARREFERRYLSLLESIDMVAVTLDTEGRATFVNDAFLRMSGYDIEEVLGQDWFSLMLPEAEQPRVRARFLDDMRRGRVVARFELAVQTRNRKPRQLLCANTVLRGPDGRLQGSSTLALDITEKQALNEALIEQTKLECLGRLAAGVAHDFSNLLTVMMGQTQVLRQSSRGEPAAAYAAIDQALDQATELTQSLLAYGRKAPRRLTYFCLDTLIRKTRSLIEAMLPKNAKLTVTTTARDELVRADEVEVRQVLINLVANACDALEHTGRSIEIRTDAVLLGMEEARDKGVPKPGSFIALRVADDGPGMDSATLHRIFEPFFTTKGKGRGTGLGLAIAHSVATEAGGSIVAQSSPGKGTSFDVLLPIARQGDSPVAQPGPVGSVLVVADDAEQRARLTRPLQRSGYAVREAEGALAATGILSSQRVVLLIIDASTSPRFGVTLYHHFQVTCPQIPVVVVADPRHIHEQLDAIVQWPLEAPKLLEAVSGLLEQRAAGPNQGVRPGPP